MGFLVYDEAGEIRFGASTPPPVIDPAWAVVEYPAFTPLTDIKSLYYSNGTVREKPPKPGRWAAFDYQTKQWFDPRTLADLKAAQWALIKQARDAQEFGGFLHAGQRYDSDQISQQRIGQAAQLAMLSVSNALPFSIQWTLEDNSVATLDALQMIAVGVVMGEHINVAHSHSRELRLALDAANSANEIDAVVW